MKRFRTCAAVLLIGATAMVASPPPPAAALNPIKPVCSVAGFVSGLFGKACSVVQHAGRLVSAGKKLATGHVGTAVKTALGEGGGVAASAGTALALASLGAWVLGGTKYVLRETSHVLSETTAPRLTSTWFSATYWRVAGIAAVLTMPFLFAAAVQALLASDLSLVFRAALGYLPLAMLAVSIAAPLTMLLLAASDQLAATVSSAAGHQSAHFLDSTSASIGGISGGALSPFVAFFVGLLTVGVALTLWLELLVRDAAVYVVVLMLPLTFAAMVWPARRIWAIRTIELLLALILSKFVIVAVLSLGGAALGQSINHSVTGILAGGVLLILGALAPWALLRLLPITEVASAAAGSLRTSVAARYPALQSADARATERHDDWASKMAQMRLAADDAERNAAADTQRNTATAPSLASLPTNGHADGRDQKVPVDAAATFGNGGVPVDAAATFGNGGVPVANATHTPSAAPPAATPQTVATAAPPERPPHSFRLRSSDGKPLRFPDTQPMEPPDGGSATAYAAENDTGDIPDATPPPQPPADGAL